MKFIKEWGLLILFILLFALSFIFIWNPVVVDGPSMDPTLANGQRLIALKVGSINRFDIVVAQETVAQTQRNSANPSTVTTGTTIVKRVIGMPGDTVTYNNDQLTINGKSYSEPYLDAYKQKLKDGTLADFYANDKGYSYLDNTDKSSGLPAGTSRNNFATLAKNSLAFTTIGAVSYWPSIKPNSTNFTIKVPAGQYLLLGDDRIVSADSRRVGTFTRSQIKEKVVFRFWPLNKIGVP